MGAPTKTMNKKEELKTLNLELFPFYAVKETTSLVWKIVASTLINVRKVPLE